MTNIQLTKPAASQTQTVTSTTDARFVLDFNTGDAQLAKSENGENLIITFEDGAKIEVEGFYTAFNKDNLPTLSVNGQDITGDQLTAILGEDLMPAAGPAASAVASAGGSNASFADPSLDGGINRLGGLDIGFPDEANLETTIEGVGVLPGQSAGVAAVATVATAPSAPEDVRPDYVLEEDTQRGGVMDGDSHTLLANDNKGKYAGFTVTDLKVERNDFGDMIEVSADMKEVTLNLDAGKLESAIFGGGTPHSLTGFHNTAAEATIPGAKYEAYYTAKDESGNYVDQAKVSFEIADNDGELTGNARDNVAWVKGNAGTINTGEGGDLIVVENNAGTIDAGDGADKLYLGSTEAGSMATGGAGNDMINVSGTNAGTIAGGGGNDTITVNENAGTIMGSENTGDKAYIDVLEGVAGSKVEGGAGSDYVTLRGGQSEINTGAGSDVINLRGDDNAHKWDAGGWDDVSGWDAYAAALASMYDTSYAVAHGGDGSDTLQVSDAAHHNKLYGDAGNDFLEVFNIANNNTLDGGAGNDTLQVFRHAHDNELYGGDGADRLVAFNNAKGNLLDGEGGNDTLYVDGKYGAEYDGEHSGLRAWGTPEANILLGGDGSDSLWATGGAINNELHGGNDGDILRVWGSTTTGNELYGDAGNDTLSAYGNTTKNYLDGGDGDDRLSVYESAHHNELHGGAGSDTMSVSGGAHHNELHGGDDGDVLTATGSTTYQNKLYGDGGNDTMQVSDGAHHNELYGGDGNDVMKIFGAGSGTSNNTLDGGEGNDLIVAQNLKILQTNEIKGGEGTDVLVVNDGFTGTGTMGNMVANGSSIEVFVKNMSGSNSIKSVEALSAKGVTVESDGSLTLGDNWHSNGTNNLGGQVYDQYTSDDMAIFVAQSVIVNSQG